MQVALSTHDLQHGDFQIQLHSLIEQGLEPDFILLHYAGIGAKLLKYTRFLSKTLRQYRLKTLSQIRNRNTPQTDSNPYQLTAAQKTKLSEVLKRTKIVPVWGINDALTIRKLKQIQPSLIICNSGILGKEVLELNHVFINIHASRLPVYRGMNNVEWALWEEQELFVTIHRIARGIDEGDILYQEKVGTSLHPLRSIQDYRKHCFFWGNQLVGKALALYLQHKIDFQPQEVSGHPLDQYYVMHPLLKDRLEAKIKA